MAKCDLCGEEAGLLRKRHKDCDEKHQAGRTESIGLVEKSALLPPDVPALHLQLAAIAERAFMKPGEDKSIIVEGWQKAVASALEDDILTVEEEHSLVNFADALSLAQEDLDRDGSYSRLAKAAVIREILEGKLPQRVRVVGDLPFNFQKGETLVWLFPGTTYCEERTQTHFEGSHQGVSVRVASGLYYRVGGFRGHPVSTSAMVNLGQGSMAITDKHIYFAGPSKSFRVKYEKIVSFVPYSDGIGIQRDARTAKPQVFITGDGWFTYNLVTNLARRAAA